MLMLRLVDKHTRADSLQEIFKAWEIKLDDLPMVYGRRNQTRCAQTALRPATTREKGSIGQGRQEWPARGTKYALA